MKNNLPHVLLLAERRDWALHIVARNTASALSDSFRFSIRTDDDPLPATLDSFDIVHSLFWQDESYYSLLKPSTRLIQSVYSHRWQEMGMTPRDLHHRYLSHALHVLVPSVLLQDALHDLPVPVSLTPEGVDTDLFTLRTEHPDRVLVTGWAGKTGDTIKQFDIIQQACDGIDLRVAGGNLQERDMPDFYRSIDLVLCASKAEGCPRPIIEGMACGCFPVTTNVGVVPELIVHKRNGYIVPEATTEEFRKAFEWCRNNPDILRAAGPYNHDLIVRTRNWKLVSQSVAAAYRQLV